jgi:hypothetical protein
MMSKILYIGAGLHTEIVENFPNVKKFVLVDSKPRTEFGYEYYFRPFYRPDFIYDLISKLQDYKLKENVKNFIIFLTIVSSLLITFKDDFFKYDYKSQKINSNNQIYYKRICSEKEFTPMSFWPYWLNKIKYENVKIYCDW